MTPQEKQSNDDRINNVFNPTISAEPPKAVNAFSNGTAPESIGSGQKTGNWILGSGQTVSVNENGRMDWYDNNGNIVIRIDPNASS